MHAKLIFASVFNISSAMLQLRSEAHSLSPLHGIFTHSLHSDSPCGQTYPLIFALASSYCRAFTIDLGDLHKIST